VKLSKKINDQDFPGPPGNVGLPKLVIFINTHFMKTICMFLILGCLTLYGYSSNPIDPPLKTGNNTSTIVTPSPGTNDESLDLCSKVSVTVHVTFKDCPNYSCLTPEGCTFQLCIYDNNFNLIACQTFSFSTCTYTFNIQAEESTELHIKLVKTSGNCTDYNGDFVSCGYVPYGGGDMFINTTYCP
jgi:hypothetical protein